MLIDWFTVGAQAINFLILVWLLKRYLYKPILNAIDAREKSLAAKLADAEAKSASALKQSDDFQKKSQAFNQECAALLRKATDEAKAERESLLAAVQKEADLLRASEATTSRNDRLRLSNEVTRLAADEVFGIARKTLADLATTSLEERIGDVFIRRLRQLAGPAKETLATALRTLSAPALVRSTFEVSSALKTSIQTALNESFSAAIPLRFETSPMGVCGIELTVNGQKVAWNISNYLASLELKVGTLLDAPISSAGETPTNSISGYNETPLTEAPVEVK